MTLHSNPNGNAIPESWNTNYSSYPRAATVAELFSEQATLSPSAIAVSDVYEQLSFQELNRKADRLAFFLLRFGVGAEGAVAVVMSRSVSMVVAMLAIVKAGATYVPIDENCPSQRLQFILEDAGVKLALTDEANSERLREMPVTTVIAAGVASESLVGAPPAAIVCGPLSRAYIMYTSGSTGSPKGVEIVHRGIVRLVRNTNYVEFGQADVVAQVANSGFDAITFEVWGALLNGARLAILESETILSPQKFARAIESQGITIMFLTASLFSIMAVTVPTAFGRMRTLVVGGDAVNPDAVRAVLKAAPPQRLVNGYGPTECTTFSVCHLIQSVPDDARSVPIGRPIANSEAFILDKSLQKVPVNEAGDLYLGGDGLARGYLNRPELTAECFVAHPFDPKPGARLYKTGDRARYLAGGVIEFLGRQDHQVKFHGFRVELGEIEIALRKHPDVIDAVVKVVRVSANDDRLVGYVSSAIPGRLSESILRQFVAEGLPQYMVPSHIVVLSQLPLNAVGKVDRGQLPDPFSNVAQSPLDSSSTKLEGQIMEIWKQILSLPSVGLEDSFFDVGGTSLTLALVAHRLRMLVDKPFEITDLFRFPTIRTLANFLSGALDNQPVALLRDAQERALRQRSTFRARALSPAAKTSIGGSTNS